jgi:hypothetical protein
MKSYFLAVALGLCSLPALADNHAAKPCEALKSEIAAKIDAKGVPAYTLDIVANAEVPEDRKVVGSCEGGTKKIVYKRG